MPVDGSTFRKALGTFASGVTVVTGRTDSGQPVGLTVSAFSSLSLDPPLILVCLDKRTRAMDLLHSESLTGKPFAVHILADDQEGVSNRFASRTSDRFEDIAWHPSPLGSPLLTGCLAWLDCSPHAVMEGGDHVIVIGLVEQASVADAAQPLLYFSGGYRRLERS